MKEKKNNLIHQTTTESQTTRGLTGQIPPIFFVTSAQPLHGTWLVAVCVLRYTVVTGLRLQGSSVFSVVVQVGEGATCLALLYPRSIKKNFSALEKEKLTQLY